MDYFSRHSYVFLSLAITVAGVGIAITNQNHDVWTLITLLVLAALTIYWVVARRGNLTPVNPEKRIRRGRSSDRPVVVYFYSDWSVGPLFTRPFTRNAERQFKGACDFIYIEVSHREAAAAMEAYEAEMGDWLLFDAAGNLVEKTGRVTVQKLEELVHRPVH